MGTKTIIKNPFFILGTVIMFLCVGSIGLAVFP